jgi:TRAP transporter TAXI family solute receptor
MKASRRAFATRATRTVGAALLTLAVSAALSTAHAQASAMKVTLAGGSVGGAWSAIGNAIGETLRKEYPGTSFTYEPGREAGNLQLVSTGKVELGIAHAQLAKQAAAGADPFKAPLTNVRAIAMIDPQAAVQIFAHKNSGITSIEQIRDKKMPVRVALNSKGTLMAITGEQVFEAYGFSAKDIESWGGRLNYVSYNNGLASMKNGQIDLIINMLAFPAGQVTNAARDIPFTMIGLSKDAIGKLNGKLGTESIDVPAGTYDFAPQAVHTVRGSVVVVASTDMKDEDASRIVSAMLKHFDFLQKSHATLARLSPVSLTQVAPLQLHPGAAAAYRKAGLVK